MSDLPAETVTLNPAMPNEHQVHHAVFHNEQQNRLHGFNSGIMALKNERQSMQEAYDEAAIQRDRDYNEAKLKAELAHADALSRLDARIDDMEVGKEMAEAAIEAYERRKAKANGGDAT